ncbi:6561_t:CDS:2 [Rhizophagus irregularis]|nr:6561_t:CDS:2 [Rhizophagus irregularis]
MRSELEDRLYGFRKQFLLDSYETLENPECYGAVFAVVSNCAKNLLEAMTIASEALRHSSDNYASPA